MRRNRNRAVPVDEDRAPMATKKKRERTRRRAMARASTCPADVREEPGSPETPEIRERLATLGSGPHFSHCDMYAFLTLVV